MTYKPKHRIEIKSVKRKENQFLIRGMCNGKFFLWIEPQKKCTVIPLPMILTNQGHRFDPPEKRAITGRCNQEIQIQNARTQPE